jgi:hypothetical protein
MIRNNVDINLRDFLERREKELIDQLAEWKRRTIPYEAELAEVLRGREALPPRPQGEPAGPVNPLRTYLFQRENELKEAMRRNSDGLKTMEAELAEVKKVKQSIGLEPSKVRRYGERFGGPYAEWQSVPEAVGIPYESLPISNLILRALSSHFKSGATIAELLEFFREKWGREIDKGSLSPQLSRLYKRGVVGRIPSLPGWFRIPRDALEGDRRAYRHRHTKEIGFMPPNQAGEQHELLWTLKTHPAASDEP